MGVGFKGRRDRLGNAREAIEPMRAKTSRTGLVLILFLLGGASAEVVHLRSGDTIEGEILDQTEKTVSVRLPKGITVSISREDIESIEKETPAPETGTTVEPGGEAEDSIGFSLGEGEPTPTPLPIVPISIRFKRIEFTKKDRAIISGGAVSGSSDEASAFPVVGKEIAGLGEEFGTARSYVEGNKYRPFRGTWLALHSNQTLYVGDTINPLAGPLEILHKDRAKVGLYPGGMGHLRLNGILVERGRVWIENRGEYPFVLDLLSVHVTLKTGLLQVEFLRSGVKIVLLEGEAQILKEPEHDVLVEQVIAPASLLIGTDRGVVKQDATIEPVRKEWEKWNATMANAEKESAAAITGGDPRHSAQIAQLERLAQAIQDFHLDLGHFPREEPPHFKDLVEDNGEIGWRGPYLAGAELPLKDVWDLPIRYRLKPDPKGQGVAAEILSSGPDKKSQEGEGDDIGFLVEGSRR